MPKGTPKKDLNKSQWIREQPVSLKAKEVVEKAKKEGISLTKAQVYTVRHAAGIKVEDKGTVSKAKATVTAAAPKPKGKPGPKPKAAVVAASAPKNGAAKKVAADENAELRLALVQAALKLGSFEDLVDDLSRARKGQRVAV